MENKKISLNNKQSKDAQIKTWDLLDEEAAREGGARRRLFDLSGPSQKNPPSRGIGHRTLDRPLPLAKDPQYTDDLEDKGQRMQRDHDKLMDKLWNEALEKARNSVS